MWNRTWSLFISTLRFLFPGHQPLTRFSGHCVTTKQLRHSQHQTMNFNRGGGKKKSFFTAVMKEYNTRKKKNQKTNSTSIPQMKNKITISHRQAFWRKPGDLVAFELLGNYFCNQQPPKKSNTDQAWFKCKNRSFQAEETRDKERTSWQVKNQAIYKSVGCSGRTF